MKDIRMEMKVCKDIGILSKDVEEYPEEGVCKRQLLLFTQWKEGGTFIQGKKDLGKILLRKTEMRISNRQFFKEETDYCKWFLVEILWLILSSHKERRTSLWSEITRVIFSFFLSTFQPLVPSWEGRNSGICGVAKSRICGLILIYGNNIKETELTHWES